jgi:hypothetical protein
MARDPRRSGSQIQMGKSQRANEQRNCNAHRLGLCEPLSLTQWIDPTGATWVVDYSAQSCIGLVKEVLEHRFQNKIWETSRGLGATRAHQAEKHIATGLEATRAQALFPLSNDNNDSPTCDGLGATRAHKNHSRDALHVPRPCLQVYKTMAKEFRMKKRVQEALLP